MQSEEESLRGRIALGWVMQLLVVVIMLLFMAYASVFMNDDFRSLFRDPGVLGLRTLVYILAFYTLMPIYVHLVHGARPRLFRWIAVAAGALAFVYFLLHHLSHVQRGERPDFTSHVFDLVHHVVSLWVVVNSVRWARFPWAAERIERLEVNK